jgi:hypothetical protein
VAMVPGIATPGTAPALRKRHHDAGGDAAPRTPGRNHSRITHDCPEMKIGRAGAPSAEG